MALVTMSHSPLMGFTEPAVDTRWRVHMALGGARKFVAEFDPQLVVLFGPDHYNGFFYDMMPSFCIGASAESIGDYDTPAGPLLVDHDVARTFACGAIGDLQVPVQRVARLREHCGSVSRGGSSGAATPPIAHASKQRRVGVRQPRASRNLAVA